MKKILPLGDNILIKLAKAEKVTKSGIILPEKSDDEKSQQGEIVAMGTSKKIDSRINSGVSVIFEKYEGTQIKNNGDEFVIIKSKNILAILK